MNRRILVAAALILLIAVFYLAHQVHQEKERCRIALYLTHDSIDSIAVAIASPACRPLIVTPIDGGAE